MKKTLTLLVASTALTAAIGVAAWSAMQAAADEGLGPPPRLQGTQQCDAPHSRQRR